MVQDKATYQDTTDALLAAAQARQSITISHKQARVAGYAMQIAQEDRHGDPTSDDLSKRMEALVRRMAADNRRCFVEELDEARAIVALLPEPEPVDLDLSFAREIIADAVAYGEGSARDRDAKTSRDFRSGECDAGDLIARVVKALRARDA